MERYVGFIAAFAALACALGAEAPGVPVSAVVTLEPRRGKTIPAIEAKDIAVEQGKERRPVTGLKPLGAGDRLQLMLLIDDSARGSFDSEIPTLKRWVNQMPPEAEVAVAYMRNGMAALTAPFTKDHTAAANGIRLAAGPGGANVSPYDSLEDAIKKWPAGGAERKIVVMVSSGIEALGGGYNSDNPYVNAGIRAALKAGVVVYTVYSPSVGHAGHSLWRSTWGQNFLSQLSDETGGESYIIGFGSPVSFQPFLDAIFERLKHQFVLTFSARPEQKAGLQPVRIFIPEKDASIAAPDKVYVPASL
jgi:hypothetical protein